MPVIKFPYGKEKLGIDIPHEIINGVPVSKLYYYHTDKSQEELVSQAIANLVESDMEEDMQGDANSFWNLKIQQCCLCVGRYDQGLSHDTCSHA